MKPDYIILFGSYARGNWVEDQYREDGILYEYKSDYDIFVVTETELDNASSAQWGKVEKEVFDMHRTAPVTLIQHGYDYLINELEYGSYFFTDIVKEGIMLYDNGRNIHFPLVIPDKLDPAKLKERAQEEYDHWFESATGFVSSFEHSLELDHLNIAAFHLHASTERFYAAVLLVFTGYKPKTHDIEELGNQAEAIDPEFGKVFPRDTPEKSERFTLLQRGYIDARYNRYYSISKEDLEYLGERVGVLRELVERVCEKRLKQEFS